jgi:hypothetical protein
MAGQSNRFEHIFAPMGLILSKILKEHQPKLFRRVSECDGYGFVVSEVFVNRGWAR